MYADPTPNPFTYLLFNSKATIFKGSYFKWICHAIKHELRAYRILILNDLRLKLPDLSITWRKKKSWKFKYLQYKQLV